MTGGTRGERPAGRDFQQDDVPLLHVGNSSFPLSSCLLAALARLRVPCPDVLWCCDSALRDSVAASREAKDILKKELGAAYDSVKVIEVDQLGANASTTASVPTPLQPTVLRAQTHALGRKSRGGRVVCVH